MNTILTRLARLWSEGRSDAEVHFAGYMAWREQLRGFGVGDVTGLRILDIGCGERAQLSLLFAGAGASVVGIDTAPIALGRARPRMWASILRSDGLRQALRTVGRDVVHTWRYWRRLSTLAGHRLPFGRVVVVRADAASMPFESNSFDLVVSSAVWEHVADVQAATTEVNRVLDKNGLAAIQIALFPSLQGGHHADWHSVRGTHAVRPWDHLRADRAPLPTYLNEWRESEYRLCFDAVMDVVQWQDGTLRGARYLQDVDRTDLSSYSDRDLLLSSVTVWARKGATAR